MEEIDKTIKRALSFICIIQNSCDAHRHELEQRFNEEFRKFVDKWKKNISEKQEKCAKSDTNASHVDAVKAKLDEMEKKEVAEIEKLLERAKLVREKYKVPSLKASCSDNELKTVNIRVKASETSHSKYKSHKTRTSLSCSGGKMQASKSDPLICQNQTSSHQTHAQSCQQPSVKESKTSNQSTSNIRANNKNLAQLNLLSYQEDGKYKNKISFISKKELSTYKKLATNSSNNKRRLAESNVKSYPKANTVCVEKQNKNGGNKSEEKPSLFPESNNSVFSCDKKYPTRSDFYQSLEVKVSRMRKLNPNILHCLWYPFLNSSNEMRLSLHLTCCDMKELKHVYTLYHKIQEALYWMDLFYLVGREMVFHIKKNDAQSQSFCLLRSYIKSIFHDNLQRTPILLPPDFSSLSALPQ